jgi:two-component system nitrate/nitrite response regulator NarL
MGSVTVAIVDDHPLFRAGVARSLDEAGGFEIVGEGSTHQDAVNLVAQWQPDILLLDISIPGGGIDAVAAILAKHPQQKIVMLTVSEAGGDVTRALKSGAQGYVLKGVEAESLSQILASVAAGEAYVSPALSARLLSGNGRFDGHGQAQASIPGELDERQRRILRLVSRGLSNKEIAIELALQEKTIKHHLTRIFSKLGVSNRTEAAMAFSKSDGADYGAANLRSRA